MSDRRRDERIGVDLPFVLRDESDNQWHGTSLDVSPTGLRMRIERQAPPPGTILKVAVQGPAETDWERINAREARVVRIDGDVLTLTYIDLD